VKDNSEPAFPVEAPNEIYSGMSLRDYFAAKSMQAIITKLPIIDQLSEFGISINNKNKYNEDIAESAYCIADAMLEERKK